MFAGLIEFRLGVAAAHAQKKPAPEPVKTYPTSRKFPGACDAVWPAALRAVTANGWAVKSSDRLGGILTLEALTAEYTGGPKAINPLVGKYTVEKSTGFWTMYTGFRFASGQMIATPDGDGCAVLFTLTYHGYERRATQGERWWVLQTNGYLEDKMLGEIAALSSR